MQFDELPESVRQQMRLAVEAAQQLSRQLVDSGAFAHVDETVRQLTFAAASPALERSRRALASMAEAMLKMQTRLAGQMAPTLAIAEQFRAATLPAQGIALALAEHAKVVELIKLPAIEAASMKAMAYAVAVPTVDPAVVRLLSEQIAAAMLPFAPATLSADAIDRMLPPPQALVRARRRKRVRPVDPELIAARERIAQLEKQVRELKFAFATSTIEHEPPPPGWYSAN